MGFEIWGLKGDWELRLCPEALFGAWEIPQLWGWVQEGKMVSRRRGQRFDKVQPTRGEWLGT